MKKFRGQGQYYRRLRLRADQFLIDLSAGQWYDLWHIHPDMNGHSSRGMKHRREHLRVLFQMFARGAAQTRCSAQATQLWLLIDPIDGTQDALYVHTPNLNHPPIEIYPYVFEGVAWDMDPPQLFAQFVDRAQMQVGVTLPEVYAELLYFIRMR